MKEALTLTATIVLYKEDIKELTKTINCFFNIPFRKKLFLIDNTSDKRFEIFFSKNKDVEYISVGKNIGFGAGHNLVIEKIKRLSKYHLILNPDVIFKENVISNLISVLEQKSETTMIAPKVLFPSGEHQFSCRRYPSLLELFIRRGLFLKSIFKKTIYKGEYRDENLKKPFFAEYITGCFQLYKTEDFVAIKGFDERYFLYMEDVDICKKIDALGKKKLYYPREEIVHVLKQGSSKSMRLFFRHFSSVIKYFVKWGI